MKGSTGMMPNNEGHGAPPNNSDNGSKENRSPEETVAHRLQGTKPLTRKQLREAEATRSAVPPVSQEEEEAPVPVGQVTVPLKDAHTATLSESLPPQPQRFPDADANLIETKIPFFGVRSFAKRLTEKNAVLRDEVSFYKQGLERIGGLTAVELERLVQGLQYEVQTLKAEANREIESKRYDFEREVETVRDELEQEIHVTRTRLKSEIDSAHQALANEVRELKLLKHQLQEDVSKLESDVINLKDISLSQQYGLYDFEHPAESSVKLAETLDIVRSAIKNAIKSGAYDATSSFTFNGSKAQGDKFVKQMGTMLLSSYNAEAENCVKSVRSGNIESAKQRLEKAKTRIEKNGTMIDLTIKDAYHKLRIKELELADRHLQQLKLEKEAEREHKAELREQAKVAAEAKAAREKLEKERKHKQNVLASIVARISAAQAAGLEPEASDLAAQEEFSQSIQEILEAEEDVERRSANMKAGYVYVVSNIGSLGEGVVKIGMTRRLDPMDRIKELSGASVPFGFDVHALFFDEDAYDTEAMLHREFANRRVNLVNTRREHFYATPEEVLKVLQAKSNAAIVEYNLVAPAEDYRTSEEMRKRL